MKDLDWTHVRVLRDDEVALEVGAQDEPLPVHSIRKSLLGVLFGRLVDDGLRLDTTVAELGVDEGLSEVERSATLEHLLTSTSGIYLPLAYPSSFDLFAGVPAPWPDRGIDLPGQRFHYSNWGFNVLGEVYQRVSGTDLVAAIDGLLARPLGFRDWDPLRHSRLVYAADPIGATPRFPNHALSLSVRDLATFGQLCCDGGRDLVPEGWIGRSTAPRVETGLAEPFDRYGYLWWTGDGAFSARGIGGQTLTVVPSRRLVVVALCDNSLGGAAPMAVPDQVLEELA